MDPPLKLLRELIAIPSVNPAFVPGPSPFSGEQKMADFLAATAGQRGLEVEFQPVSPGRPNLLVRLGSKAKTRQRILLLAHLDTVGGSPLDEKLFQPREKNGRVYGRGACDTKGCVAAMLAALGALAQNGPRPNQTEIYFAGVMDEENGQCGSRALVASGFKADLAIVGEPTRLQVVTAHKGSLWLRLATKGRAAHGSRPELGHNAIHDMARIVHLLETEYAETLRNRSHPMLRPPTINVGMMHGGTQANIVPDACEIIVDRRTLPGETETGVRREISALLRRHHLIAHISDIKDGPCDPLQTDASLPLVQNFLHLNGHRPPCGVDFFCDASILSRGGIPSLVFGPGDIAQAHTADEWISVKSLQQGTLLLTRFLQSLS